MDLTPNKSSILLLAIYTDWIRRKWKETEQTCLSFNYRMILFCPLWLSLVFLVFLPLCRALLPCRSARCQHPKCLQFERETAVIVLFSPLQICVSVLVQLTIVIYFVACVLQLQRVGDVVGEVGVAGRRSLSLITWTCRSYWACTLHPKCIFTCMHKCKFSSNPAEGLIFAGFPESGSQKTSLELNPCRQYVSRSWSLAMATVSHS